MTRKSIPANSTPAAEVLRGIEAVKTADVDWRGGRVFSLDYHAGEAHERLLQGPRPSRSSATRGPRRAAPRRCTG